MSFWQELRRRNVVKVGTAYLVVAWLLVQVVDVVLPMFNAPAWIGPTIVFVLAIGLPIVLIIAWAFEITRDGIKKTESVPVEHSITHITGQRLNYIVTGLLGLALSFVIIDQYVLREAAEPTSEIAASFEQLDSVSALPNSVAVLPLENLSPNPDNAYVAAGLHEEILNQLAKLRNLNVIARTSVMRYAENRPSIEEIARSLNVQSVMEGSVRYAGDRIRVTTQLIDAGSGAHLWSETYDRQFGDIFAIESDIAMNVANALQAEFSEEEQARIERPLTESPAAYALVLRAIDIQYQGNPGQRIHALMDQAIALDPNFARAYAIKASWYAGTLINTLAGAAQAWNEIEALVREYAGRALAIDAEEPVALSALATISLYSWRWADAREAYDLVYETSGQDARNSIWLRAWSGDLTQALTRLQESTVVNPFNAQAHWIYGMGLHYAGDYDAALERAREAVAQAPPVPIFRSWLAWTLIALGDLDEARRELQVAEQLLGENRPIIALLDIAYAYGRVGDHESAQRIFDEVSALTRQGQEIGAGGWALLQLAIGNDGEALEQLRLGAEKARRNEPDAGFLSLMNIKMNVTANPVLESAEFADIRNQLSGN